MGLIRGKMNPKRTMYIVCCSLVLFSLSVMGLVADRSIAMSGQIRPDLFWCILMPSPVGSSLSHQIILWNFRGVSCYDTTGGMFWGEGCAVHDVSSSVNRGVRHVKKGGWLYFDCLAEECSSLSSTTNDGTVWHKAVAWYDMIYDAHTFGAYGIRWWDTCILYTRCYKKVCFQMRYILRRRSWGCYQECT